MGLNLSALRTSWVYSRVEARQRLARHYPRVDNSARLFYRRLIPLVMFERETREYTEDEEIGCVKCGHARIRHFLVTSHNMAFDELSKRLNTHTKAFRRVDFRVIRFCSTCHTDASVEALDGINNEAWALWQKSIGISQLSVKEKQNSAINC